MPSVTLNPTDDASVYQGDPDTNYGSDTFLTVASTDPTFMQAARIWLKFDLSTIPVGSTINSAHLKLNDFYCRYMSTYYETYYGCRLANGVSWTEGGITWNTAPDGDVLSPSLSFTFVVPFPTPSVPIVYDLDATADVAAVFGVASTISWRFNSTLEGAGSGFFLFSSKEYSQTPLYSQLVIDYTAPVGGITESLALVMGF